MKKILLAVALVVSAGTAQPYYESSYARMNRLRSELRSEIDRTSLSWSEKSDFKSRVTWASSESDINKIRGDMAQRLDPSNRHSSVSAIDIMRMGRELRDYIDGTSLSSDAKFNLRMRTYDAKTLGDIAAIRSDVDAQVAQLRPTYSSSPSYSSSYTSYSSYSSIYTQARELRDYIDKTNLSSEVKHNLRMRTYDATSATTLAEIRSDTDMLVAALPASPVSSYVPSYSASTTSMVDIYRMAGELRDYIDRTSLSFDAKHNLKMRTYRATTLEDISSIRQDTDALIAGQASAIASAASSIASSISSAAASVNNVPAHCDPCPICLEDFTYSSVTNAAQCGNGHLVCRPCFTQLKIHTPNASCPLCRAKTGAFA